MRTRFPPFRHQMLVGSQALGPSVAWLDSWNLLVEDEDCGNFEVKCDTCDQEFYIFRKEAKWHDVAIDYGKR
jgi:hypothetical protein